MYRAHADDAEARQQRSQDFQEQRARERALQPQRRNELSSAEWHDVSTQINQTVNAGLQALDPEFMAATPRGPAIAERFQMLQNSIVHAVRQRLPEHLPRDPASRGMMIEQIYNDVARGITRTEPSGHWYTGGYTPSSMMYNEQNAAPRHDYGPGPALPAPAPGTAPPPDPGHMARMQRVLEQYDQYISPAAREFNVPPTLIAAVIGPAEGGTPNAASAPSSRGVRAYGLMQIEPPTFVDVARRINAPPNGIFDPATNIRVGTAYLSQLLQQYRGNYTLALAAYNWGPAGVNRILTQVSAGAPRSEILARLPVSTQAYLARVGNAMGGWDSSGQSFVGMPGATSTPNAPPGAASRNVVQTSPTGQYAGVMETVLNNTERTARMYVHSVTSFTERQQAKERAITEAMALIRQNYPQFSEWAIGQLRARLQDVR